MRLGVRPCVRACPSGHAPVTCRYNYVRTTPANVGYEILIDRSWPAGLQTQGFANELWAMDETGLQMHSVSAAL